MISVSGLYKYYGEKTALENVSFDIARGELVGLLGLNGAGKSTLMNILTGCLSPSRGAVHIGGHDIAKEPVQAKALIGYLPESPSFYSDMRVCEYLEFVCDLKKVKTAGRKEHLDDICGRVGIGHVARRMIRNLSKGYRQRVGFAQALAGDPAVLFLDEPTVGLDPSQIAEIRALIKSLSENATILISSHILPELQSMCGRFIILSGGRVTADVYADSLDAVPEANATGTENAENAASGGQNTLEKLFFEYAVNPDRKNE